MIPAETLCDHRPDEMNPRLRGVCVKCGRKIVEAGWITVGEASELWMLLQNNARPWNRKLRNRLERVLELGKRNSP